MLGTVCAIATNAGKLPAFLLKHDYLYSLFTYGNFLPRRSFLGPNWDKNLYNFCSMLYSQTPPSADFTPPYGFLGLEISTTADSGWGIGLFPLFLCLL